MYAKTLDIYAGSGSFSSSIKNICMFLYTCFTKKLLSSTLFNLLLQLTKFLIENLTMLTTVMFRLPNSRWNEAKLASLYPIVKDVLSCHAGDNQFSRTGELHWSTLFVSVLISADFMLFFCFPFPCFFLWCKSFKSREEQEDHQLDFSSIRPISGRLLHLGEYKRRFWYMYGIASTIAPP